jgi:aryl-alcohol dehydrogenase-like predicted oxidoreductase
VQATWNLLEPSAGPALAVAHAAGLGVIVKEAVANGRLTVRDPRFAHTVAEFAPGLAPDAVALAVAFGRTPAHVVLSGASTVDQLIANLGAFAVPLEVVAGFPDMAESPERYWHFRSRLAWT